MRISGTTAPGLFNRPNSNSAGYGGNMSVGGIKASGRESSGAGQTGTIAAEVRRIEAVEATEFTRGELIKQASVAMLAQANLRRQDVLDILGV